MTWRNKVIWSEGLFLRPVHFQQQDRYVENYVQARCTGLGNHGWGFSTLKLDRQLLGLGKIAIAEARGVLADGTPFDIPENDDPPPPLELSEEHRNVVIYLALPLRRAGMDEVSANGEGGGLERYVAGEFEACDTNAGFSTTAPMQIGKLNLRFLLEGERLEEYACIGVARVVEMREDKNVVLDDAYLATVLDCHAESGLIGFAKELQGLLHHRGEAIGARVTEGGRGGTAEIADFLLLQTVNRYEPVVTHLVTQGPLHPETLYRLAVEIAGEIATFTTPRKRAAEFPPYRHDDLQSTFSPVMAELRRSLSMVLEQNAVPIPLEERRYGIRVAALMDRTLLKKSTFVLAVRANMPTEEIRKRLPMQVKIGPVERIRELVNLALPGITVQPLAVAPRQLPYHAGSVYFELDQSSEFWVQLQTSGGIALHLSGEFPGIEMELWAIRG